VAGHAAGFDCVKSTSLTEKAICADGKLSKLDSELSAIWKKAISQGGETAALKSSQLRWLKQRDTCGDDASCLGDRYHERLASLSGKPLADDRWQQTWYLDSNNPSIGGTLTFTGATPHLHFEVAGNNGGNDGGFDGDIALNGEQGTFHQNKCQLDFTRRGMRILLTQIGTDVDCGAGMGVYYAGDYIPASQFYAKPRSDLLSLKVLTDAEQNAAAHKLLGAAYQALLDTVNTGTDDEPDLDRLNARVGSYWVRGLASTNASMVMSRHDQLWIGLLVFDTNNQTRMRYYTNAPEWGKKVPKTIRAWHDNIDKDIPIDIMR
jgi:uncharacterized protein YecT (DUF1311 family)